MFNNDDRLRLCAAVSAGRTLFALCLGLSLAACGGAGVAGGPDVEEPDNAAPAGEREEGGGTGEPSVPTGPEPVAGDSTTVPAGFGGTWRGDCTPSNDSLFVSTALIITDGDAEQQSATTVYSESSCVSPLLETRTFARFDFGTTVVLADGSEAVQVDVTASGDSVVIPLDEQAAAGLTFEGFCETTDWTIGVSVDTTDCTDVRVAIEPLIGQTVPQIYSVQQDDLLIGQFSPTAGQIAPEVRPTALDYRAPLRRVTE